MTRYASIRYVTLADTLQGVDFKRLIRLIRMKPPRTHSATHTPNATTPPHTHLAHTYTKRIKRYISNIKDLQPFKRINKRIKTAFKRIKPGVLA